ncbi:MBL fold metallo-hydrolase [Paenibacillus albiflavus]|uniref:MBL fold metallo-hydrolase n=1 Tax=Paenibacillus albiflavus TaxID=2545760 RepID=A0A4R4ER65_9BACL|nr:MBL fold metallo-hydrolase [Paenibacillus albiflavus]TCZ80908.1 MBL fold metallo-hydrolase [Paenibacillus albiflavus]
MRTIKHNNVYQLTFMPRFFPVNCYLVEEEDSLTLIDAAMPYSVKGIMKAASKIGKPITRIVLTHAHGDHVGALDGLKQLLPDAKVYISKRDAKLLAGDSSLEANEGNLPIKGSVPKNVTTRPDVLLQDGDRFGSLLAIATPGHTPGSMAFLDTRDHAMIAGDAIQIRGGIAVSGQLVPLFPFPAMATWNKEVAIESAMKLAQHKPTLLAVGHGNLLVNPEQALKDAIAKAMRNQAALKLKGV